MASLPGSAPVGGDCEWRHRRAEFVQPQLEISVIIPVFNEEESAATVNYAIVPPQR